MKLNKLAAIGVAIGLMAGCTTQKVTSNDITSGLVTNYSGKIAVRDTVESNYNAKINWQDVVYNEGQNQNLTFPFSGTVKTDQKPFNVSTPILGKVSATGSVGGAGNKLVLSNVTLDGIELPKIGSFIKKDVEAAIYPVLSDSIVSTLDQREVSDLSKVKDSLVKINKFKNKKAEGLDLKIGTVKDGLQFHIE